MRSTVERLEKSQLWNEIFDAFSLALKRRREVLEKRACTLQQQLVKGNRWTLNMSQHTWHKWTFLLTLQEFETKFNIPVSSSSWEIDFRDTPLNVWVSELIASTTIPNPFTCPRRKPIDLIPILQQKFEGMMECGCVCMKRSLRQQPRRKKNVFVKNLNTVVTQIGDQTWNRFCYTQTKNRKKKSAVK